MTSGGAEDTGGGWNTKEKDSSCSDGGKWENAGSVERSKFLVLRNCRCTWILFTVSFLGEGLQNDPWANKIASNGGTQGTN